MLAANLMLSASFLFPMWLIVEAVNKTKPSNQTKLTKFKILFTTSELYSMSLTHSCYEKKPNSFIKSHIEMFFLNLDLDAQLNRVSLIVAL